MTHGSLFTGFGMFDYAAEKAGYENIFQVENNEFCQRLLNVRYPKAEKYKDINDFIKIDAGKFRGRIDVISGGFPCQPHSIAGKRKGREDDRNLFPQTLEAIRIVQPGGLLLENVYGILNTDNGKFFEQDIITPLENEGYTVQPYIIPASAIGAVHRRDRLWIIAQNTKRIRCDSEIREEKSNKWGFRKFSSGSNAGIPNKTLTNSKETKCKWSGNTRSRGIGFANPHRVIADTKQGSVERPGRYREPINPEKDRSWQTDRPADADQFQRTWIEVATQLCRIHDAPSDGLHKSRLKERRVDGVGGSVLDNKYRKNRLEGLGNGVQWEIPYIFFTMIKEFECQKR